MTDFQVVRENMIKSQLMPHGITHPLLLKAFKEIPREQFVPLSLKKIAYLDDQLELSPTRFLMAPLSFAKLVQSAEIKAQDIVLDIGSGLGYSSVILSFLAKKVVGLESSLRMTDMARFQQGQLEITNLHFETGPLIEGWSQEGPYTLIFFEGVVEDFPESIINSLLEGGKVLAFRQKTSFSLPVGSIYIKSHGCLTETGLFQGSAPLLEEFKTIPGFRFSS